VSGTNEHVLADSGWLSIDRRGRSCANSTLIWVRSFGLMPLDECDQLRYHHTRSLCAQSVREDNRRLDGASMVTRNIALDGEPVRLETCNCKEFPEDEVGVGYCAACCISQFRTHFFVVEEFVSAEWEARMESFPSRPSPTNETSPWGWVGPPSLYHPTLRCRCCRCCRQCNACCWVSSLM
jgi:hypothetical protein